MYNPSSKFAAPRTTVVLTSWPFGKFNNETTKNAKNGAYLDEWWANEFNGFAQAALVAAGAVPNNTPEQADSSQVLDAIKAITNDPIAPKMLGVLDSTVAGTWAPLTNAVNVASAAPVTSGSATADEGDLRVLATTTGTKPIAVVAMPDRQAVELGAMVGALPTNAGAVIKTVSAFGFRATIEYNGTTWIVIKGTDPAYNSSAPALAENILGGYVDLTWTAPSNAFKFCENWFVQEAISSSRNALQTRDYTPLVTQADATTGGISTRVYFLPNKPVRATITRGSGSGDVPTLVGSGNSGIDSMSWDDTNKKIIINHKTRSGPAFVQFSAFGGAMGAIDKLLALQISANVTHIVGYNSVGTLEDVYGEITFSREPGAADAQTPETGTRISVSNGVGIMPQDSRVFTGTVNVHQVTSK